MKIICSIKSVHNDKTAGQPFCTASNDMVAPYDKVLGLQLCTAEGCPKGKAHGGAL